MLPFYYCFDSRIINVSMPATGIFFRLERQEWKQCGYYQQLLRESFRVVFQLLYQKQFSLQTMVSSARSEG